MEPCHSTAEVRAGPVPTGVLCHQEPGDEVRLSAGRAGVRHILVTGMVHNTGTTEMGPSPGYTQRLTCELWNGGRESVSQAAPSS